MNISLLSERVRCPICGSTCNASVPGSLCTGCLIGYALSEEPRTPRGDTTASETSTEAAVLLNRRIGRYELLEEIDRGGVGIVYRAWQADLKREVALKMLLPERLETKDTLDRFRREAELMAALNHPGTLPVYEVGEQNGLPYFSMRLAEGGNLAERVAALRGRFQEIARLLASIARAISYAHGRGVLHRDLKPSNIVFDGADQPMVTDFGLARHLAVDSSLTGIDALIGTPRYVAPEVVVTAGVRLTVAADVYGLGAILYELLCGCAPFADLKPLQVLQQIATAPPRPPRQLDATIPARLEAICLRCLEKRAQDRYPSANALADALEAWLAHRKLAFFQDLRWLQVPSRRRRVGILAASALVGGLAAAAAWHVSREPIPIPDSATATRTVVVLPDSLKKVSPSEREAARQVAAHLHLPSSIPVLPFESTLDVATSEHFPDNYLLGGATLGAFVFVEVVALPNTKDFGLRAQDVLRNERLFETTFALTDVDSAARNLAEALRRRREQPTPEAHLPRNALASFLHAEELLSISDEKNNEAAISLIKEAITRAPDSALAHAKLAQLYGLHGGDEFWGDSAIEEAARAQRMDPTLGSAANQLGRAYYFKTWFTRAERAFEQARTLGNLSAAYWLGLLYYEEGHFDDSYRMYREDQRFDPDKEWTKVLMAHLLFTVGENDAGERLMRSAIAQDPKPELRAMKEAEIALYRRESGRCREIAGGVEPETSDLIYTAAEIIRVCAVQQGDFAGAFATLDGTKRAYASQVGSANSNNPARMEAILLAQLHQSENISSLLAEARQGLQAGIDSNEEEPSVWWRMAAIQRLEGDVDTAYATLEHAFTLGLTVNNRNRFDLEFLPFLADARFQALQVKSEAYVAAQREKVAAQIDPALRMPIAREPSHVRNAQSLVDFRNPL